MQFEYSLLLEDTFTLLVFLQTRDIKLRGAIFLPVPTQRSLATLMHPSASVIRDLPSDLVNHRVKFCLFLCYCAGLLASVSSTSGRLLKPSPAAAPWLAMPMAQRAATLVQAMFADDTKSARLWAQLRLPGWRVIKAALNAPRPFRFGEVRWSLLENKSRGRGILWKVSSVLPLDLPLISDAADAQPDTLIHALLTVLIWFGIVNYRSHKRLIFQLHPAAAELFQPIKSHVPTATTQQLSVPPPALSLTLRREPSGGLDTVQLVETQPADWSRQFDICRLALLVSTFPRVYQLQREQTLQAFDQGITIHSAIDLLESVTGEAVPHSVNYLLSRWWREHKQVQIQIATVIRTTSADLLDELLGHNGIRQCIAHRLSADTAEVRPSKLSALLRRLKYRGILPQVHFQLDSDQTPLAGFGAADWAHIYQAILLAHHLPDLVPLAWRTPDALVRAVSARLDPVQVNGIHTAVEDLVRDSRRRACSIRQNKDADVTPLPMDQLERATELGQWLRIRYHAGGNDEVTERDVQPRRIEWRGAVPYLIAWCSLRRDERTFRVDRIMAFEDSPPGIPVLPASA